MPLPINLKELLSGRLVESERLELKEGWNPEAVVRTLCAFANDFHNWGGGYLVMGVAERGGKPSMPPLGLDPGAIDGIQRKVLELGHAAIRPAYHPVLEPVVLNNKHILVLWCPGGLSRPYRAKASLSKESREWVYYIRRGSTTTRATGDSQRELLSLAASVPFDDRPNSSARKAALSRHLIVEFLRRTGSLLAVGAQTMPLAKLAHRMNLLDGPAKRPLPRNVGLMFFNPNPQQFFPYAQVDVVWFPDGVGGDRFEEKTFDGPLGSMARDALDFIRRNYLSETVIKRPDRAEAHRVANFPYAAVEEAVINAIYHRDYQIREPVEVRISPHELAVLSFPGPDRSISLADLRRGRAVPRRYRNRRIGEFLKELELTEGRATGIPKILRAMAANGSPPPRIETDPDRTSFLIRLPVHPDVAAIREAVPTVQDAPEPYGTGDPVSDPVGDPVERLLAILQSGPLAPGRLRRALGLKHRPTFRSNYLRPALAAGAIEMTDPEKPNSRLQQYRLTEFGRSKARTRRAIQGD